MRFDALRVMCTSKIYNMLLLERIVIMLILE